jgi:hypothetical protein
MRIHVLVCTAALAALPGVGVAGDDRGRDRGYAPPCEEKVEQKRGEYKREVKCKDGRGAFWRGTWKDEYRDGPCLVKVEADREQYKEEVKCEDD